MCGRPPLRRDGHGTNIVKTENDDAKNNEGEVAWDRKRLKKKEKKKRVDVLPV